MAAEGQICFALTLTVGYEVETKFSLEKLKESGHLQNLGVYCKIILQRFLRIGCEVIHLEHDSPFHGLL
jgi:hypothetical protein